MLTFPEIALDFVQKLFSFDKAHPLLFTQFYFWAFFAIVFAIFCLFKNKTLLRNSFLFFVSLFFYYKTSGLFTLILIFMVIYNFLPENGFIRERMTGAETRSWPSVSSSTC